LQDGKLQKSRQFAGKNGVEGAKQMHFSLLISIKNEEI